MDEPLPPPDAILLDLDGVLADIERRTPLAPVADLEALAALRPIAVITSCPRRLAEAVLVRHGFRPFVRALVASEDGPGKPSPAPVRLALKHLGARSAWMLGDNPSDVVAARAAGVVALAIEPRGIGAGPHALALREAGARRLVAGLGELLRLLRGEPEIELRVDDLRGEAVQALLREHLASMRSISPPESVHALDLDGLRAPNITFWSAWRGDRLVGSGALKELDPDHGEIKSMRTAAECRRQGVGAVVLRHLLAEARRRGYRRVSLETGSQAAFAPARALYARFGFAVCGPFGDYRDDPNSAFFTLLLE